MGRGGPNPLTGRGAGGGPWGPVGLGGPRPLGEGRGGPRGRGGPKGRGGPGKRLASGGAKYLGGMLGVNPGCMMGGCHTLMLEEERSRACWRRRSTLKTRRNASLTV